MRPLQQMQRFSAPERGLVAAHGGTVTAHTAGVGTGSKFSVELPFHSSPGAVVEVSAESRPEAAPGARILVVDDNVDGAEMLALLLEQLGHVAFVATNVHEAMRVAEQKKPTVD